MNGTTAALPAGQLAALDQAISAYREAARAFAYMTGTGAELRAAEAQMRHAGYDAGTGLVTIPAVAVHFTDERADGARPAAMSGSLLGGEAWICWRGRAIRFGVEPVTYDAWDLVQVRA